MPFLRLYRYSRRSGFGIKESLIWAVKVVRK
jgi:hypothetical protein